MRETTEISEPVRSCIGCRSKRPQSALVRITRSAGSITVGGASTGRGAWICRDGSDGVAKECLHNAIKTRAFARAWRGDVSGDDVTKIVEGIHEHNERVGPR